MAAPFDAERLELIGPAIPVIEGVMMTHPRSACARPFRGFQERFACICFWFCPQFQTDAALGRSSRT